MSEPLVAHVDATATQPATLEPPLSKSDAQRALVLAHAWRRPELVSFEAWQAGGVPQDVVRLRAGLAALAGPDAQVEVDCGDGGAPFRFLLTQAALTAGKTTRLWGSPRLGERPHQALLDALVSALEPWGLRIRAGNPWPVQVTGAEVKGPVTFRVVTRESSQFASSLLLGAATLAARTTSASAAPPRVVIEALGGSLGYLELTVDWLRRFGLVAAAQGGALEVRAIAPPAAPPAIPGDWSALGYLLACAWRTGARVLHADRSVPHPDAAIARLLESTGLSLIRDAEGGTRVEGHPRCGVEADGEECPDLLPTLAALACVLPGPSTLRNVGVLRAKESDRLEGIRALVLAAGGHAALHGETLVLSPRPGSASNLVVDPRGDHRMAMAAGTLAVLSSCELSLRDPECVAKSFPAFWDQLARLGVRVQMLRT